MSEFPLLHDPLDQKKTDTWFCKIPILGWQVAYWRQCDNEAALVNQAVKRGPVPEDAWAGRSYDPAIREKLSKIVIDRAYPKGSEFHPDDPFELMMVLRYGDLNECEIMMDIEDAFGIKFTDVITNWLVEKKVTFIQFIQYIQTAQQGGQPDAFGAGYL
jgi:hypothetical protein